MTKKEVIKRFQDKMRGMTKPQLLNLLDAWEGQTPRLPTLCRPDPDDCFECGYRPGDKCGDPDLCLFPEDRICDEKDCDSRVIES